MREQALNLARQTNAIPLSKPAPGDPILTIDQALVSWLAKNFRKSQSHKTRQAYEQTITDFRSYLQERGHDLDSDRKVVADLCEQWANESKRPGKEISAATYRQRLSIISSFYEFSIKREVLTAQNEVMTYNPIQRLDRERRGSKHAARPMEPSRIKAGLARIDRTTPQGMRDYALLTIALSTGHRASELTGLRLKHLHFGSDGCLVEWERCKGNKQMTSELKGKTTSALLDYLHEIYGPDLQKPNGDAPVWVSFSRRNAGAPIGYQTVRIICEAYLGVSKVHTTRHSAAVRMMKTGATLEEIRHFTGHANIKELATYLEDLTGYTNPYAEAMEEAFCLDD